MFHHQKTLRPDISTPSARFVPRNAQRQSAASRGGHADSAKSHTHHSYHCSTCGGISPRGSSISLHGAGRGAPAGVGAADGRVCRVGSHDGGAGEGDFQN